LSRLVDVWLWLLGARRAIFGDSSIVMSQDTHHLLFTDNWATTIAPHQTQGSEANPAGVFEMMRSITGKFEEADFAGKFSGWLETEADKFPADEVWLCKDAAKLGLEWDEKAARAYVEGRGKVRKLLGDAGGHLIIAFYDTLWHPGVNATLVASGSLEKSSAETTMKRALLTAGVLEALIGADCSACLWYYLGQTHHDYINRHRAGGLVTGKYVGDAILYTILAFAVVPGTSPQSTEDDEATEALEDWRDDDIQTFWAIAGRLLGYGGPLWANFEEASRLYRELMVGVAETEKKVVADETMSTVKPSLRVKQF
jgi:hypothetical protein